MAYPGSGYRSVWSMMIELSLTLVEDFVYTSLTNTVGSGYGTGGYGQGGYGGSGSPGLTVVTVGSLGINRNAVYIGAELVVDPGQPNQEIVTVTAVNPSANQFTAEFIFGHNTGALVVGGTFPVQASSGDFFFSQQEIQSYLARAQNEFLAQVPCIFGLNTQFVQFGQIYQQLVCDAIEMNRVASSSLSVAIVSLTRWGPDGGYGEGGYGTVPNLVVAVSADPHGLAPGQKFSIFNTLDPSFEGAFQVWTVPDPVTWTYLQVVPPVAG